MHFRFEFLTYGRGTCTACALVKRMANQVCRGPIVGVETVRLLKGVANSGAGTKPEGVAFKLSNRPGQFKFNR